MASVQNVIHIQRRSAFGLGALVGGAVTALWVVLSISTGLIFHFHPLLVGAGTAWGFKRSGLDVTAVSMSALVAAALVTVGALVITEQGGALDPGWFIALETAVGVALGVAISRRRGDRDDQGLAPASDSPRQRDGSTKRRELDGGRQGNDPEF